MMELHGFDASLSLLCGPARPFIDASTRKVTYRF